MVLWRRERRVDARGDARRCQEVCDKLRYPGSHVGVKMHLDASHT